MATFTLDEVEYTLVSLSSLDDLTLSELGVLEKVGGLKLSALSDGEIDVTTDLLIALVLLSMRRVNPEATVLDAGRVSITVLEGLAETVANVEEEPPPTTTVGDGGDPA